MKIYHLPIEPYETRYTADWIQQYENEFIKNNVDFETILGETNSSKVTTGGVLDACGTHLFKFTQLCKIISKIQSGEVKDNDVIFFADLWFPGLESLFYIRNMLNIKFKIMGIFHAGTYDKADFTYRNHMRNWGKYLEASWFNEIDKIFVATQFHKDLIIQNSIDTKPERIIVTGLPFYATDLRNKYLCTQKEDIIVFPHRIDPEKHPELFDELLVYLKNNNINIKGIKTIVETKNRQEYFKLLAKSKLMISFADQETFGYSTLESMALNNIVIVPNKLSYVETVPDEYRYNTKEEAFKMVLDALLNYKETSYDLSKWEQSVFNMIKEMKQ